MLFNGEDVRNIRAGRGQPGRQPSLWLPAGVSLMVSYLIVRLEMQYLHIVFHTAVTSADASDKPEGKKKGKKKHAGHRGEVRYKAGKHKTVLSPQPKEPQKVQFVLTPSQTANYTPHPSLSTEKPTEKCILSAMELLCLCSFEARSALIYGALSVVPPASCLMTK